MNIKEQGAVYIPTCHFAEVSLIPAETDSIHSSKFINFTD